MLSSSDYLVIHTDLDATLLDHHTYSWEPARPALEKIKERDIPLVLNSSKTFAEMRELAGELQVSHPLVCENGSYIAIPKEGEFRQEEVEAYFSQIEAEGAYLLCHLGVPRAEFLPCLRKLRNANKGYDFKGYQDWSVDEIVEHTGLDTDKAKLSADRNGTEPIHWHGSETAFEEFESELSGHQLKAVSGGRFIHISGHSDKANGLEALNALYQHKFPRRKVVTIALGDSPNDIEMLNAADIAITIPNKQSLFPEAPVVIHADSPGPEGWNTEILKLLDF